MAIIKVFTDDGREVSSFTVDDQYIPLSAGNTFARNMLGLDRAPLGWLGRALSDAKIIQAGGDPERASEHVMRLLSEQKKR